MGTRLWAVYMWDCHIIYVTNCVYLHVHHSLLLCDVGALPSCMGEGGFLNIVESLYRRHLGDLVHVKCLV